MTGARTPSVTIDSVNPRDEVFLYGDETSCFNGNPVIGQGSVADDANEIIIEVSSTTPLEYRSTPLFHVTRKPPGSGTPSNCQAAESVYQVNGPPNEIMLTSTAGYNRRPEVRIQRIQENSRIVVYKDSSCSENIGEGNSNNAVSGDLTFNLNLGEVTSSEEIHLYYKLIVAGTEGTCSSHSVGTYLVRPTPEMTYKGGFLSPSFSLTNVEGNNEINLYTDSSCSGEVVETATVPSGEGQVDITVPEALASGSSPLTYYIKIITPSSPPSPCFGGKERRFTKPSLILTPSAPSFRRSGSIRASNLTPGDTAQIFGDSTCETSLGGSVVVDGEGNTPGSITVGPYEYGSTTSFYIKIVGECYGESIGSFRVIALPDSFNFAESDSYNSGLPSINGLPNNIEQIGIFF